MPLTADTLTLHQSVQDLEAFSHVAEQLETDDLQRLYARLETILRQRAAAQSTAIETTDRYGRDVIKRPCYLITGRKGWPCYLRVDHTDPHVLTQFRENLGRPDATPLVVNLTRDEAFMRSGDELRTHPMPGLPPADRSELCLDEAFEEAAELWRSRGIWPSGQPTLSQMLIGSYEVAYLQAPEFIKTYWDHHIRYIESLPAQCRGVYRAKWAEDFEDGLDPRPRFDM